MNIINNLHQKKLITIFVIYLRYLIGGAMVFSSIVKIKGERFTSKDGINEPLHSAWHLFETLYQSGIYWRFLGWSQLLAGMLLMTQLYSALGAVVMLPITINIFVITISYYFAATPAITFLLLLANIFLLLWEYEKLIPLFQSTKRLTNNAPSVNLSFETDKLWVYIGILIFIVTILHVIFLERTPFYWFLTCLVIGISGLIIFFKTSFFKSKT